MNFPLYIAKRYLFSKSSTNAINIITMIAMFGVVVGSLALFIVLSGFSGLQTFSASLLENSDPDVKITASKGKSFFVTDSLQVVFNNKDVVAASKVIEERVFLRYKDKQQIAEIKGVDTFYNEVVPIDSTLRVGTWLDKEFSNAVVLGRGLSYKLSVGVLNYGEPLQILVPKPGKGFINPASAYRSVNTQILGLYQGSDEFQNKFVFTNLELAQELLKYKENQVTAIELKLKEGIDADNFTNSLQQKLGDKFTVKTRAQLNALYFKVVNTENFISYLIFTLIVIIALFNVIGSIIMMIIDKKQNLKTLYNLGTTLKDIKKIFVLQGFLLSVVGMLVGLFIGIIAVLLQLKFGWFKIAVDLPYPVEFRFFNVLVVTGTLIVLGYIASKIASSRISINFIEK
ncbi:ABC transporter permease [Tenacibaculum holothuriorum]|uniref:ABC transporter permease n=1 Tax=Tenacibaculum holothuriorum TaxID=1635173 RepID=A0A1Y2PFZ5_9FLAO|nr:ABC transporter permease [Tenacibaculum holothuriorum]OSY88727.1 ABC transporter permease [Tenacibaculum holothuriorum]